MTAARAPSFNLSRTTEAAIRLGGERKKRHSVNEGFNTLVELPATGNRLPIL